MALFFHLKATQFSSNSISIPFECFCVVVIIRWQAGGRCLSGVYRRGEGGGRIPAFPLVADSVSTKKFGHIWVRKYCCCCGTRRKKGRFLLLETFLLLFRPDLERGGGKIGETAFPQVISLLPPFIFLLP